MRKLLVCSQKGGVGKTTTAIALAGATALGGTRVLLLDADPLSNIASALNLADHPQRQPLREAGIDLPGVLVSGVVPGLDVLSPYDDGGCNDDDLDSLLALLATPALHDHYGCLVVDTPPFMGPNPGQLVAACDEFLLVMRSEAMAYRTLPAFLELMQRTKSAEQHPIKLRGILLTLPEGETPAARWERELRGRLGTRILPQVVPHDDAVAQAAMGHQVVTHAGPDGPAAEAYRSVAAALEMARDPRDTVEHTSAVSALQLALAQSKSMPRKPASVMRPAPAPKPVSAPRPAPAPAAPARPRHAPPAPRMRPDSVPLLPEPDAFLPPAAPPAPRETPAPAAPPGFPAWVAAVVVAVAAAVGVVMRFAPLKVLLPGLVGVGVAGVVLLVMRLSASQQPRAARPAPAPAPAAAEARTPSRRLSGLKRRLKMASRDPRGN